LVSYESTLEVLKIASTTIIEDAYTLTLPLIKLSQSGGSILKSSFI